MILGELEKRVLNHLWSAGEADAKQIHSAFSAGRSSSLEYDSEHTGPSVQKQLLSRSKQGHAFVYRTRVDREDLIAQLIRNITSDLVSQDNQSLMAAFVSLSADLGDDELSDRLEAMIQNHRRKVKHTHDYRKLGFHSELAEHGCIARTGLSCISAVNSPCLFGQESVLIRWNKNG